MIYQGVVRGRIIELDEALPFGDGQVVRVVIESIAPPEHRQPGSPAAVLDAMDGPPHVDPALVDQLEQYIRQGTLPVRRR